MTVSIIDVNQNTEKSFNGKMKFTLEFPAGGFNKNSEKPKIAAIRELFEETGINISQTKRLKQLKRMSVNPQRHSKIPYA